MRKVIERGDVRPAIVDGTTGAVVGVFQGRDWKKNDQATGGGNISLSSLAEELIGDGIIPVQQGENREYYESSIPSFVSVIMLGMRGQSAFVSQLLADTLDLKMQESNRKANERPGFGAF
jgi:hypothetical protein